MGDKFLILLSAARSLPAVLQYIEEKYSIRQIDILQTSDPFSLMEEQKLMSLSENIQQIWKLKNKDFSPMKIESSLLKQIQNENYDHAIVLANDITATGYGNVEKLAYKTDAHHIFTMDQQQNRRRTGDFFLLVTQILVSGKRKTKSILMSAITSFAIPTYDNNSPYLKLKWFNSRYQLLLNTVSPKLFRKNLMEFLKCNDLKKAEALIGSALRRYPENLFLHEKYADISFKQKNWSESARRYENIFIKFGRETPTSILQKLRTANNKRNSEHQAKISWKRTCSKESNLAENCYTLLLDGYPQQALDKFSVLLNRMFSNPKTRLLWLNAFYHLCSLLSSKKTSLSQEKIISSSKTSFPPPVDKKIIVSGMGWSGSGALYDYFKEFSDVTALEREYRLVEGQHALKSLWDKLENPDLFKRQLVHFFAYALFGFAQYDNPDGCKTIRSSQRLTCSNNNVIYAMGSANFLQEITKTMQNDGTLEKNKFRHLATRLLDTLSRTCNIEKKSTVIFDNLIHLYNLSAIEILKNSLLFCTFRDPRSNYVALVQECPGYIKNVEQFIFNYREKRTRFEEQLRSLKYNRRAVFPVQFEKFVHSLDYRQNIAKRAGLNIKDQNQHNFFKPWESKRNVLLHQEHNNQDAIKKIEKKLPEYCFNL